MYDNTAIRDCYSASKATAPKKAGAIAGGGTSSGITSMENCYYLVGAAVDGNGTVQNAWGWETAGEATMATFVFVIKRKKA